MQATPSDPSAEPGSSPKEPSTDLNSNKAACSHTTSSQHPAANDKEAEEARETAETHATSDSSDTPPDSSNAPPDSKLQQAQTQDVTHFMPLPSLVQSNSDTAHKFSPLLEPRLVSTGVGPSTGETDFQESHTSPPGNTSDSLSHAERGSGQARSSQQRAEYCISPHHDNSSDDGGEEWTQIEGSFEHLRHVLLGRNSMPVAVYKNAYGGELMCVDQLILASGQPCAETVKSLLGIELYMGSGRVFEGDVFCNVLANPARRVDVARSSICLQMFEHYLVGMDKGPLKDGMEVLVKQLKRMANKEVGADRACQCR